MHEIPLLKNNDNGHAIYRRKRVKFLTNQATAPGPSTSEHDTYDSFEEISEPSI